MYKEITGDLIAMAKQGHFDVIAHGCNCFCTMKSGIAPQMADAFGCNTFTLERLTETNFWGDGESYEGETKNKGDINKLGQIDYRSMYVKPETGRVYGGVSIPIPSYMKKLTVVNTYTQYHYGRELKPFDYEAFTLCMRKINHDFKGKHIGLPQIGAGLAGGQWGVIKQIIIKELKDCDVTVVIYNK